MMPWWWFVWVFSLFWQPQPAYQLQYQQQLLNYTPPPIVVNNGSVQGGPQYVVFPPCRVISPNLTVCS